MQRREVTLSIPFHPTAQELVITPDDFDKGFSSLYVELWKDADFKKLEKAVYSVMIPFIERYRINTLKVLGVISIVLILSAGSVLAFRALDGDESSAGSPPIDATDTPTETVEDTQVDGQVVLQGVGDPQESQQGSQRVHVVQQGENLFRISQRYGVSVEAFVQANNISDPGMILIGQLLIIPAGATEASVIEQSAQAIEVRSASPAEQPAFPEPPRMVTLDMLGTMVTSHHYCVNEGETLSQIAQRFGVTVEELVTWNNLPNAHYIQMGQFLVVVQPQ